MADVTYLTPGEVAAALRCSARSVRRAIDRGDLRAVRVGPRTTRVAEDDLQAFVGKSAGHAGGDRHAA